MTNTITPTPAITNRETTVSLGGDQFNGIGQPGSTVSLLDNGNPLVTTLVQPDGTWTLLQALTNGPHNIIAHDKGSSGLDGTSSTFSVNVDTTKPSNVTAPFLTMDPSATMLNGTTASLSGVVFDPDGVKSVNILSDGTLVGAATVNPATFKWSFSFDKGAGDFANLTADAVDVFGNTSHVKGAFELVTGVQDAPFASEQITNSLDGNISNSAFYSNSGSLLYSSTTSFDAAGNASGVITGAGTKIHYDVSSGDQSDEIVNFHAAGNTHDFLNLAGSNIHNAAQLFSHAHTIDGNTTLKLTADTSITLDGVSKADLHTHKADFTFA